MKRLWSIALVLTAAICVGAPSQKLASQNEHAAWIPPDSKLGYGYVKTAQMLLGNGLGDPRGGDFREVSVDEPDYWLGTPAGIRPGWVLKGGKTAVLLDGLEYPIKSVGPRIDIERIDDAGRAQLGNNDSDFYPLDTQVAAPALFLIAGHRGFAESVYSKCTGDRLAEYLFNRIMLRSTQALVKKEYGEALSWARRLVQVAQVSKLRGLGFVRVDVPPFSPTRLEFALDFCRDMERCSRQQLGGYEDSKSVADITHLIQSMDLITGIQVDKSSVAFDSTGDPVYAALLKQGKSAVPALIDVVEHDRRFTGMFVVGGGMPEPSYTRHPVPEIAEELLTKIWPSARLCFTGDRESTASALRKSCVPTRNGAFLSNGQKCWLAITQPREMVTSSQSLVSPRVHIQDDGWSQQATVPNGPLEAATLQAKRGPEIATLIAKRALQLAGKQSGNADDLNSCADALLMGECLGIWSPALSLGPLQQLTHITQPSILKWMAANQQYSQVFAEPFARVIVRWIENGDRSAIADLSQVIQIFEPEPLLTPRELKPFWMLPDDPAMQAVVEKYMALVTKDIVSSNITAACDAAIGLVSQVIDSPILASTAFRKMLAAGCANPVPGLEAWLEKLSRIDFSVGNGWAASVRSPAVSQDLPLNNRVQVTAGDLVAQYVSDLPGAPVFCMVWPVERRSAAKQELVKWLLDDKRDWSKVAKSAPGYSEGD